MVFSDHSKEHIQKSGGRVTKTKLAVLEVLEKTCAPLSPYGVADAVKKSGGKIDVVTVYRILESFLDLGLVHKSEKGFIPCSHLNCEDGKHCHHQFLCSKCEKAFEIHLDDKDFLTLIRRKFKGFRIESHDFRFSGFCKNCKS